MAPSLATAARRLMGRRNPSRDPLVEDLAGAIGADRVRADTVSRYLASRDASIFREGTAGPVCYPISTEQVQACVRVAAAHGRAVVPRGAGTGLAGAAAPLGRPVVLSLMHMNRLLEVDIDNGVAWVQPGVVESGALPVAGALRRALRTRPVEPAGVHHRRKRCQQFWWAALSCLRRHQCPCAGHRSRALGWRRSHNRRPRR